MNIYIKLRELFGYRQKLEAFLLHAMEAGLVSDGALAQDINQASSFWRIREVIFSPIVVNECDALHSTVRSRYVMFI